MSTKPASLPGDDLHQKGEVLAKLRDKDRLALLLYLLRGEPPEAVEELVRSGAWAIYLDWPW